MCEDYKKKELFEYLDRALIRRQEGEFLYLQYACQCFFDEYYPTEKMDTLVLVEEYELLNYKSGENNENNNA